MRFSRDKGAYKGRPYGVIGIYEMAFNSLSLPMPTYGNGYDKVELERDDYGRWSAWIEELPGCAAWGYTQEEALDCLEDAATAYIEDMVEAGGVISADKDLRIEAKLRAIYEASRHEFPAANIEDMLREIDEGRRIVS